MGYIFVAADSICVALQISEQFFSESQNASPLNAELGPDFNGNDHSRSFKVIRFGVNEQSLRGYIVQYNNCGLECEGSEDISSEKSENRHLRPPHSHLTPTL